MSAIKADAAKRMPMMMVATKMFFSAPRRVREALMLSLPPKVPPRSASDCWTSTRPMRITDRIICIYGRNWTIFAM